MVTIYRKYFLHEKFKLEIHYQKVPKLQAEINLAQLNFPTIDFFELNTYLYLPSTVQSFVLILNVGFFLNICSFPFLCLISIIPHILTIQSSPCFLKYNMHMQVVVMMNVVMKMDSTIVPLQ